MELTVKAALLQGSKLLEDAAVDSPRLTAEVLLAHAIGCPKEWLYAHGNDPLTELWWIHYGRYLHERLQGKPTQYITGVQEFYGRSFRVSKDVLIPRPETEHVVEAVLERIPRKDGQATRIADIGAGSGAIAVTLSLELGGIQVYAVDLSREALSVARANAASLGAKVAFAQGDLLTCFASQSLDVIASNPPYIPLTEKDGLQREVRDFEPHLALFAGEDGMSAYSQLASDAKRVLKPGGWLVMELAFNASEKVSRLLSPTWRDVSLIPDLAGYPRVIAAQS